MIKRCLSLLLSLLLMFICCAASAELQEEELYIEDWEFNPDDVNELGIVETDGSRTITVTCTGDFTIGGDNYHKKGKNFYGALEKNNNNISFTMANVRDIFRHDDLTLVNFEGTFTNTKYVPSNKTGNQFLFNIDPKYVSVLTDNFIEAVSLENNHVMDHGDEGFNDTVNTLRDAGIIYSTSRQIGVFSVDGTNIAMLSYLCIDRYDKPVDGYANLYDKVAADIAYAKQDLRYDIVIVSFHWGNEKDYYPTERQIKMGRLAVDSGADLVVGHHSHRINPIEEYKGVYICYSLGNFCFSGHDKPSDMSSFLFQIRFRVAKDRTITTRGFRIIPIRISSLETKNDYIPTPLTDDFSIESVLKTLKENGNKHLDYHVAEYPLEWKD
ncbi:MAG: CapA family protein [Clostridiales bacterium]|nr:CapA family protein [Clostridiales bacterium]